MTKIRMASPPVHRRHAAVCPDGHHHLLGGFHHHRQDHAYDLWRESSKSKTRPWAWLVAAMCLGISIIVAAAIH